jgi:DNA (cytosine-5)-methyltransferase 1
MEKLNALDLFSGIGGNTLALSEWTRTIAYCDFDKHAQSVLLSRMRSGDIKPAPIWDDVSTLTAEQFSCPIDIIVGGFPCQDISVAGKGAGINEETRSGLFFQVVRLVRELRPTFIFLENVPAIRTRGLDIVLRELTQAGYDCRWTMLSASSVGALHKRERWFLLAHANGAKLRDESGWSSGPHWGCTDESADYGSQRQVADSTGNGRDEEHSYTGRSEAGSGTQGNLGRGSSLSSNGERIESALADAACELPHGSWTESEQAGQHESPDSGSKMANAMLARWISSPHRRVHTEENGSGTRDGKSERCGIGEPSALERGEDIWAAEPNVGRVAAPFRVDRLKRLGNTVVPQQAREAFEILIGVK